VKLVADTLTKDWKSKLTNGKAVYLFEDGDAKMRDILGGKGANLAEMTRLGFPGSSRLHGHHRGL
jgi:hypothetical protein